MQHMKISLVRVNRTGGNDYVIENKKNNGVLAHFCNILFE